MLMLLSGSRDKNNTLPLLPSNVQKRSEDLTDNAEHIHSYQYKYINIEYGVAIFLICQQGSTLQ